AGEAPSHQSPALTCYQSEKSLHAKSFQKISIQMITLIALFRFIAMKGKPQNPKETNKNASTDSLQKNINSATSHRAGTLKCARVRDRCVAGPSDPLEYRG